MDLTIIVPTRSSWSTLPRSIEALSRATQDTPARIVVFETGDDHERLQGILDAPGALDYEIVSIPSRGIENKQDERYANLLCMWAMAMEKVTTPYMMRVDSDLVIPTDSIHRLMTGMLGNSRLGEYAIPYRVSPTSKRVHDHVTCGCTMFRMEALREIAPIQRRGSCDCKYVSEKLLASGWEVRTVSRIRAEHIA